jgi:ferric-dicitrate binding protein FerR (iron transport regulator)
MHVSHPLRFPEDRPESLPMQPRGAQRRLVAVIALFVAVMLSVSLWMNQHGIQLACAEDVSTACGMP